MVIVDTCGIIELGKSTTKLKEKTIQQIDQKAYILSVSFAEIACKVKAKKLAMNLSVEEIYENFSAVPSITIVDIDVELWLSAIQLNWPSNRDPVDRLVAAFAIKNKLSIVTSDTKIKKFYKKILW